MYKSMKEFIDKYGANLIIKHNKSNIILETDNKNIKNNYFLILHFEDDTFKELRSYLETIAKQIWCDFTPKEANSFSSDYEEYYDRKYDNNAYLNLYINGALRIEKPDSNSSYLYKFNKKRTESFIYDLAKF